MNLINTIFFSLFIIVASCGRSQKDIPVLLSQKEHLLYILNSENELLCYDINKAEVISRKHLENVLFPVQLFANQKDLMQQIVLFTNSGVNYKIISSNETKNYRNKSFSHISDIVIFDNELLVNTINGLYICADSLQILKKIYCNNNDSTCDISLSILGDTVVLSETNNLYERTSVRIMDSNYIPGPSIVVDGIVKSKIYKYLNNWVYIKEMGIDAGYFAVEPLL